MSLKDQHKMNCEYKPILQIYAHQKELRINISSELMFGISWHVHVWSSYVKVENTLPVCTEIQIKFDHNDGP